MADPLRAALEKKYSRRHVDRLVTARANEKFLTRRLAMLSIARDAGISWVRYATAEELAALRGNDRERAVETAPAEPSRSFAAAVQVARPRKAVDSPGRAPRRRGRRDRVFVVHGRNEEIRSSMFAFLRAVGLDPVEWGEALNATGKAMPYIAETLEAALSGVAAVVVLITPDDEAVLKERFWRDDDPEEEKRLMGQARPNVIYEAGMAVARHPEKTVFVLIGRVKSFSDIGGLHVARLNNKAPKRSQFVDKLRRTGADVQTEGRDEWYTVGNFEVKEDNDGNQ